MRERNFETSHTNFRLDETLKGWQKWADSKPHTEAMKKMLEEVAGETLVIKLRKEVLENGSPKFRRRDIALDHGRIEGDCLVFDVMPMDERRIDGSRLGARVGRIKDKSYLILETPADKPFGFLRPGDIESIRI